MLLPLSACLAIYCHCRNKGPHPALLFAAGFLAITTLLYKYTALPVLVILFGVWLVEAWRDRKRTRLFWRWLSFVLAGACAAFLVEMGVFLIHDGGAHAWECTVLFNQHYVASNNFGFNRFLDKLRLSWAGWWILFMLPAAAVLAGN